MKLLIKQLIKEKGMTQKEVCEKAGISRPLLTLYYTEKSSPTLKHLKRIADVLEVSVKDLFVD